VTARLTSYVWVTSDEHESQWFGPGDELPDWAVAQIDADNDKAWAEKPAAKSAPAEKRGPGRPAKAAADK
jgi:hypothetical protein